MDSVLLTKIVSLIIYPLGFACVLMVFGGVMHLLQRRHLALGSWVLCVGILLLASNPMLARHIAYSLEQQFPQKALVDVPQVDAVIVLGGGVGNIDELYTKGVEEAKKYVFNNRLDTVFLKPQLGDSAGVFGAALL